MRSRIQEEEAKAEELVEKERSARAELNNVVIELKKAEARLSGEHTNTVRISADYESTRGLLAEAQREILELKTKMVQMQTECDTLRRSSQDKQESLEQELISLKDTERTLRLQYTKQLQEIERLNMESVKPLKSSLSRVLETTPTAAPLRTKSSVESLATLPSGMASSATYERLQMGLQQHQSEIVSLKQQIEQMEVAKAHLEDQLVKLTTTNDHNVMEMERLRQVRKAYEKLEKDHSILMELYGAKEERVEELRDDIKDMKLIYQTQIDQLVTQLESLKK